METNTNNGLSLSYDKEGSGAPLLLITGLSADRGLWGYARPKLNETLQTIALDNRDSGKSALASDSYSAKDLAMDALAILDAEGIEKAHVLGHSMGGAIAQELAILAPGRVDKLVLSNSFAKNDLHTSEHWALARDLRRGLSDDLTFLRAMYFYGLGRGTLSSMPLSAIAQSVLDSGPIQAPAAFLRQIAVLEGVDTEDRLASITAPTLVLWSPEDKFFTAAQAEAIAAKIPSATVAEIPGTGHCPMIESPDAFTAAVLRFLA